MSFMTVCKNKFDDNKRNIYLTLKLISINMEFYLISLRKEANKSRKSYLTNKINKTNK